MLNLLNCICLIPPKKCAILCVSHCVSNVFIALNLIPPKSVLLKCEHLSCVSLLKWLQYALYASKRMCLFKCEGLYGLIDRRVLNLPYDAFNVLGSFSYTTSSISHPKKCATLSVNALCLRTLSYAFMYMHLYMLPYA